MPRIAALTNITQSLPVGPTRDELLSIGSGATITGRVGVGYEREAHPGHVRT
jgi:hypothetical protein